MKKLTPETRLAVLDELSRWRTASQALDKLKIATDPWFVEMRIRNSSYNLIQQMTGLSMSRTDSLCWGHATLDTYWLTDGSVRKNITETLR